MMSLDAHVHWGDNAPIIAQTSRVMEGHEHTVLGLAPSHVDHHVCSVSKDFTARLWDVEAGKCITVFEGHHGAVRDCVFSPDGKTILTAGDDCVRLWDRNTGRTELTLKGHFGHVTCVDCCSKVIEGVADGLLVLSGSYDQTLKLWDLRVGHPIRTCIGHSGAVFSCAVSRDVASTYSVGADVYIRVFDISVGHTKAPFSMDNPPGGARHTRSVKLCGVPLNKCAISPDGTWLAAAANNATLCMTKLGPDITTMFQFKDDGKFAWQTAWRRDGKMVCYTRGEEVVVWGIGEETSHTRHTPNATCLARLRGSGKQSRIWGNNGSAVWGCCFMGDAVLSGGEDGSISVWKMEGGLVGEFGMCQGEDQAREGAGEEDTEEQQRGKGEGEDGRGGEEGGGGGDGEEGQGVGGEQRGGGREGEGVEDGQIGSEGERVTNEEGEGGRTGEADEVA